MRALAGYAQAACLCKQVRQQGGAVGHALGSVFLVAVANAVQGFDLVEIIIHLPEFFADPLDVAVNGAVIHIHGVSVGRINQLIAGFDQTGALRKGFDQQKLGYGQGDILPFPCAFVAQFIKREVAACERTPTCGGRRWLPPG